MRSRGCKMGRAGGWGGGTASILAAGLVVWPGCGEQNDRPQVLRAARSFYTAFLNHHQVGAMRSADWDALKNTTEPTLYRQLRADYHGIALTQAGHCTLSNLHARKVDANTWVVPVVQQCTQGQIVGLGVAFRRSDGHWRAWEIRDRRSPEERAQAGTI